MGLPQIGVITKPAIDQKKGTIWTPYGNWLYEGLAIHISYDKDRDYVRSLPHYKTDRVPKEGDLVVFEESFIVQSWLFADEYVPAIKKYFDKILGPLPLAEYPFLLTALDLFRNKLCYCKFEGVAPYTEEIVFKAEKDPRDNQEEYIAIYGEKDYPLLKRLTLRRIDEPSFTTKWQSLLAVVEFKWCPGWYVITAHIV